MFFNVKKNRIKFRLNKHFVALIFLILITSITSKVYAQQPIKSENKLKNGLKFYLSKDSVSYIKATGLAQLWLRYTDNNPGSTVYGKEIKETYDVGVRRMRYQVLAQLNKRVFFYSQIGINSVNNLSARKTPIFFHDVTAEYTVAKKYLTIGLGLNGWNGVSRYTSSGVGNILCLDLPIIQEPTNDVIDQFVRKNGIYAKGKVSAFDYRISVSNPYPIQQNSSTATLPINDTNISYFSTNPPKLHYQGYFMWQFLEEESNQLPYMTGSYLGKKRVLNIGSGFSYQENAMWNRNNLGDTVSTALQQIGVDVFFDYYLNKEKENAITIYASYINNDFGPNYIRTAGIMNTANGANSKVSFSGYGNSIPLYGTGQVVYSQFAYLFRKDLLKSEGTLQPYVSCIVGNYKRLDDPMIVYDLGLNWIQAGQNSKVSLDYQSRPIFHTNANGLIKETKSARRGSIILQYQVMF